MKRLNRFVDARRDRPANRRDYTDPSVLKRVRSRMIRSGLTEQDADKVILDFLDPCKKPFVRHVESILVDLYLQGRATVEWQEGRGPVWWSKE